MIPKEPGRRQRVWYQQDPRRQSAADRGYGARWQVASEEYRRRHPLCVPCLLAGYVRPSRCVDHIVPAHSCPELFWEVENWAAMCLVCHGRKTRKEPQHSWSPNPQRIVVCGLPGTGKSTWAKSLGFACWDADDHRELLDAAAIVAGREAWIDQQRGNCVVIVASITTASILASRLGGVVRHMTTRFFERPIKKQLVL